MVSESCPKLSRANRLINLQMSNKGLQKEKGVTIVESHVRLTWYQSHAVNLVVPIGVTIVESHVRLTWYQSHAVNLVVPID